MKIVALVRRVSTDSLRILLIGPSDKLGGVYERMRARDPDLAETLVLSDAEQLYRLGLLNLPN